MLIIKPGSAMLTLAISRPRTATASTASSESENAGCDARCVFSERVACARHSRTLNLAKSREIAVLAVMIMGWRSWVSLTTSPLLFEPPLVSAGKMLAVTGGSPGTRGRRQLPSASEQTTGKRSARSLTMNDTENPGLEKRNATPGLLRCGFP